MKFTKEERKLLEQNENVIAVGDNNIFYTKEFKEKAIAEYTIGKSARQIFEDAGFDLSMLSKYSDYASKIISKWRQKCSSENVHFSKKKIKKAKTDYQKMQERLEYLEAENEFLKKLSALCDKSRA